MKLRAVRSKRAVSLEDDDARVPGKELSRDEIQEGIREQVDRISDLQRVFYADARHALLIVLQGRDAAGKDGTIRKVFSAVNPQGCAVTSFKPPSETERTHDFLWRVHQQVPARGIIGIFNRSHYEDVLVPRVHGQIDDETCAERYRQINDFERMLSENGVVILKFLLHISQDEQKKRLNDRLTDTRKNWKFQAGDLDDRERWRLFTEAYGNALGHTSTKWAPWYIVPADDKKVRNLLVARTIADAMAKLKPAFPKPDPAIEGVEVV